MDCLSQMFDIGRQVNVHISHHVTVAQFHTSAESRTDTADIDSLISYFFIFLTEHLRDLRGLVLGTVIHNNDLIIFKCDLAQILHRPCHTAFQPQTLI